jgi:hypothetical protein
VFLEKEGLTKEARVSRRHLLLTRCLERSGDFFLCAQGFLEHNPNHSVVRIIGSCHRSPTPLGK